MTTNANSWTRRVDDLIYKLIQFACFTVFTSFFVVGFAEPKYTSKDGLSFDSHQPSNEAIAVYAGSSLTILGLKGITKTVVNGLGAQ